MIERRQGRYLPNFLSRFFSSKQEAADEIEKLLEANPHLSKHEVFRQLSEGRGRGKPHWSGKRENELMGS